jgi:type IV secretory pathway VirB3-like protein
VILMNICLLFYNFLILFSIPYSLNSVFNSILVEFCFQSSAEMILVQIWICRFGVLNIFVKSDSKFFFVVCRFLYFE